MQTTIIQAKAQQIKSLIEPPEAIYDRGLFFGDGVYEVVRSYNGKIFALDDHLQKLTIALNTVHIIGVDVDRIKNEIYKVFNDSNIVNAKIYFHITRGFQLKRSHTFSDKLEPNFFLTIENLPDDDKDKMEGIAVLTYPDQRWGGCNIKSLNLLPNILARQDAKDKNAQEAIFVDKNGYITEGSASTFFAVFNGAIQTAPLTANILPGITRKYVIQIAKNLGISVYERSILIQQVDFADELFTAATCKDIIPVVNFNNKIVDDGKPGTITKLLMKEFTKLTV